jgi:hypothetical protein
VSAFASLLPIQGLSRSAVRGADEKDFGPVGNARTWRRHCTLSRLADGCQWEASRREIDSVLKRRAWARRFGARQIAPRSGRAGAEGDWDAGERVRCFERFRRDRR